MSSNKSVRIKGLGAFALSAAFSFLLTGCDDSGNFALGNGGATAGNAPDAAPQSVQLVERDVEAPQVFQVTDKGLWDGRPSLGGVWVAHPDVTDPERVIIRNQSNGKFVIGALFRRERENPGPALQVSSDAADALGMLAGAPVELSVTALRREEVPQTAPAATTDFGEPAEISAEPLDPIAGAAAAIDAAEASAPVSSTLPPAPQVAPAELEVAPEAAPVATAPETAGGTLSKPFIQIGIFSIEENATQTADRLRSNGILPTVRQQSSQGRTFWRVLVGPAMSASERDDLLAKIKAQGFADAYPVSN